MKYSIYGIPALLALLVLANFPLSVKAQNIPAGFNADSMARYIADLASDAFQGRKPFTPAETKTINYIKDHFVAMGIEPGNGKSYFQDVPMVKINTNAAPSMKVSSPKGTFDLRGHDDYVMWTDKTIPSISFINTDVVFAGYGVVAPEYNWDDYAGLDVKGKIVLVMVNDPGFNSGDTSLFKGRAMTWYGRWPYKYAEAAKHGAKGCLIIHNPEAATYPFTVVQNNWNTSKFRLDNRGKTEQLCDIIGWISTEATNKLLSAAGMDQSLLAKADIRGFRPVPLPIQLSSSMEVKVEYNQSHNVIGKITGTKYPNETIIYTAHWDHLGIGTPDAKGDSIYNGAIDNASGVAALLELASAFKALHKAPERSVIFLAVTAEEQGLLGSAYYAENPVYPIAKTVANLNMDEVNWYGKTKDLIIIGRGQNDLEDYLKEETDKAGRVIGFDAHPETGSYYRSDHFNFAKAGVPALETRFGDSVIGKPDGYGELVKEAHKKNTYHRPSDEYHADSYRVDGALADMALLFGIGKRLAFGHEWPGWKDGSEFKALRK